LNNIEKSDGRAIGTAKQAESLPDANEEATAHRMMRAESSIPIGDNYEYEELKNRLYALEDRLASIKISYEMRKKKRREFVNERVNKCNREDNKEN
jgi:hypothetical protein